LNFDGGPIVAEPHERRARTRVDWRSPATPRPQTPPARAVTSVMPGHTRHRSNSEPRRARPVEARFSVAFRLLRLRQPKRLSNSDAIWAAFGSHHHPVDLVDFGPYNEITTEPIGPRECADAPPFVTPELRAAHRVGAPVCRRGRVHHRPYDAAHN
jgi:hypothetical protein